MNKIIQKNEVLDGLLETAVDAIIIINEAGLIERFNQAAEEMFHYQSNEVMGKNVKLLMPEQLAKEHNNCIKHYIKTGHKHIIGIGREIEAKRKNGEIFSVHLSVSESHVGEKKIFMGIIRDVSEFQRIQKELFRTEKFESIGHLASGLAHDFKNLIAIISGNAQLIMADPENHKKLKRYVKPIMKATEQAEEITDQLFAFAEEGSFETRPLNMNKAVLEVKQMISQIAGKSFKLKTNLEKELWQVEGGRSQINQVFLNIVLNARDAMPDGGEIFFQTENFIADERYCLLHPQMTPGAYVHILIRDTGVGMTPRVMEKIFDPFFTTKVKGTGLGLSMVYSIVKKHHGEIVVQSKVKKGTTFHIYLPALMKIGKKELSNIGRVGRLVNALIRFVRRR